MQCGKLSKTRLSFNRRRTIRK